MLPPVPSGLSAQMWRVAQGPASDPRAHLVLVGAGIEAPSFDPNRLILNELQVSGSFVYDADVRLMRETVGEDMGVKASGGIRTLADLQKMITAGATRVGSSSSVRIIEAIAVGDFVPQP